MSRFSGNDAKFDEVRSLNLPIGHYAITSSGALGIREIRAIGDVDIIVDDKLWDRLAATRPVTHEASFDRIRISPNIEVFGKNSFLASRTDYPTVYEQIRTAELIKGLPFVRLEYVLFFKKYVLPGDPTRTKWANDFFDVGVIEVILDVLQPDPVPALHSTPA